jgi:hypothetical protein
MTSFSNHIGQDAPVHHEGSAVGSETRDFIQAEPLVNLDERQGLSQQLTFDHGVAIKISSRGAGEFGQLR